MKTIFRISIILIFSLLIAMILQAQDSPSLDVIIPESVNVRSGPNSEFQTIGSLFQGAGIVVLNRSADGQWVLVRYAGQRFGWVQASLIDFNRTNPDLLPVLNANITPSPVGPPTNTPFFPTNTPSAPYIDLVDADVAIVRAGPGRTFLYLGVLRPGDEIEVVGRNENASWLMIRFAYEPIDFEGFGWVSNLVVVNEVNFDDLPILSIDNLTPTATLTPSRTPVPSATNTNTFTPTATHTATSTYTSTPTFTATYTVTASVTASSTPENTATSTPTFTPSHTHTATATNTAIATDTATTTHTATYTATATNTSTNTPTATQTNTPTETPSLTPTITPTSTETRAVVDVALAQETVEQIPTQTSTPTNTPSPIIDDVETDNDDIIVTDNTSDTSSNTENDIPIELVIGMGILGVILIYAFLYWRGLAYVGRYKQGFVIETCPVCGGNLIVEERPSRTLGIPSVRRSVRCDNCRSTLREVGSRTWRYAVDPMNPTLYEQWNNREITDEQLKTLKSHPESNTVSTTPSEPPIAPEFTDDNEGGDE